ncbi:MAG: Lysine exporter protein [Myxococcales bacterium]|nr:Lysine exporter protein [Myxococcales bacterium]
MNIVGALALGVGLGVVTGMPLGVVNVAIVDASIAHRRRHAIGLGIGGALADTVHAGLAFVGLAALVTTRPDLVRVLAVLAAIAIGAYALMAWRRHRTATTTTGAALQRGSDAARSSSAPAAVDRTARASSASIGSSLSSGATASSVHDESSLLGAIPAGLALTLPNPGALAAWVAVAASLWPRAQTVEGILVGIGVGLGSAAWFTSLAILIARIRRDHPALRYLPPIALAVFLAIAITGVIRVL